LTEILTESFCERCGTRYTFEPVVHRRKALSGIGTLGRGIRHFVSDPGSTLDEAMAVARSETEQRSTASALEAFHRTFNFCLSCRQYTCADCWNTVEGRCLSCAPTPDAAPPVTRVDTPVTLPRMDIALAAAPVLPLEAMDGATAAAAMEAAAEQAALADAAAIAEADARVAAQAAAAEAEAEATAAREAVEAKASARVAEELAARDAANVAADAAAREAADAAAQAAQAAAAAAAETEALRAAEAEAQAVAAALAEADAAAATVAAEAEARAVAELAEREAAEAETRAAADRAAAAVAPEQRDPTVAFEPGLNLDDQIAAYERERAAVGSPAEAEPEPAPVALEPVPAPAAPEPEPEIIAEPEPVLADAAPVAEVIAEPEIIAEPAERAAASFEPIPTAVGQPVPASIVDGPLRWPEPEPVAASHQAAWPDQHAATREAPPVGAGLPSEPVHLPAPARACPSCGLSLSASARFCRRCGTPQQLDAPR
jgi:hypothetical protein